MVPGLAVPSLGATPRPLMIYRGLGARGSIRALGTPPSGRYLRWMDESAPAPAEQDENAAPPKSPPRCA